MSEKIEATEIKITYGFVTQRFENGKCVNQEFEAGDPVEWEDECGDPIEDGEAEHEDVYQPFHMVQPDESEK